MATSGAAPAPPGADTSAIVVERYKYILQQIHTVNENVYRFLTIYQTIVTALVTAAIALFVNYRSWGIAADVARTGIHALLLLATAVAAFTVVMIVVGLASWLDYRREECELTDRYFESGFRRPPQPRNWYRWYETYILAFVVVVTIGLWTLAEIYLIPRIT